MRYLESGASSLAQVLELTTWGCASAPQLRRWSSPRGYAHRHPIRFRSRVIPHHALVCSATFPSSHLLTDIWVISTFGFLRSSLHKFYPPLSTHLPTYPELSFFFTVYLPEDTRDAGSIPGSERFPGGGNPLQNSCLEKFMDRGVWRAMSLWGHKSQTRLCT